MLWGDLGCHVGDRGRVNVEGMSRAPSLGWGALRGFRALGSWTDVEEDHICLTCRIAGD